MDSPLWTTRDNDDMPSLDIDLAAQDYLDDYNWADAYGQEANMFTPLSYPHIQHDVDQLDMGVAHGSPLDFTQSIETEDQQLYSSDLDFPMTPPPSNLSPGHTPRSPATPDYYLPGSSQPLQSHGTAYTNPISTFSPSRASYALPLVPTSPARGSDQRMPSSPSPIGNGTPLNPFGMRIVSRLLSEHEAVCMGTFLDFLRMDDMDSKTHAVLTGIIATKGFKLSPISRSKLKRPTPSDDTSTTKRRKLSSSSWWGQFFQIDLCSHNLEICAEGQALLDDPSALLDDICGNKAKSVVPSDPAIDSGPYGELFLYTMALNSLEFRTGVMKIVMRLFYYIISHNSIDIYIQSPNCRLPRLFPEDIGKLHRRLEKYLPTDCATLDGFKKTLHDLRSQGSSYAFLAKKLGLGSLIMLRDLIPPNKMWACTKGSEKSGISDQAFAHLHSIGVPAQAATIGADKAMHTLLWEVCSIAPGFPSRKKRLGEWEPFPGFEYTSSDGTERETGEVAKHGVGEEVVAIAKDM